MSGGPAIVADMAGAGERSAPRRFRSLGTSEQKRP